MDFDFLKELYFKELERRELLDDAPSRAVTILTLVAGVYTFYFQSFTPDGSWCTWILGVSVMAAALLFFLAIVWIFRASVGYGYSFLAFPDEFERYANQLRSFYRGQTNDSMEVEDLVAKDVSEFLRARLIEATTRNSKNNNRRSELLYNVKRLLAGLAGATLVSGFPILIQLWNRA